MGLRSNGRLFWGYRAVEETGFQSDGTFFRLMRLRNFGPLEQWDDTIHIAIINLQSQTTPTPLQKFPHFTVISGAETFTVNFDTVPEISQAKNTLL